MTSTNEITGDKLITKSATEAYRAGWDRIFRQKVDPEVCSKCKQPWKLHEFGIPPICPILES